MLFSSLTFILVFLPLTLAVYFGCRLCLYKTAPKVWVSLRNVIILVASLVFYSWGEPKYVLLMIMSILVNYALARMLGRFNHRKVILIVAIIINILIIGFFKYANFLTGIVNSILGTHIPATDLPLPIGISFYTFQILSYIIDVYRGRCGVQKNIIRIGTYISLFPALIAGPIVRYETIEEQLSARNEDFSGAAAGFKRFIIGLGKKVLIANQMAIIADTIYDMSPGEAGGPLLWLAAIAYTFQIYFDFSGYSDMAIGLGKIFGFTFLENFNYPYISGSVTEFWRRWHISLSSWFRDYVYIPLGGNRVSRARWLFNILVVWFLTGLWHGAAWNFIFWGLYYGVLLVVEKLFLGNVFEKLPRGLGFIKHLYTIFVFVMGWVLFRVEDFPALGSTFKAMFTGTHLDTISILAGEFDVVLALPFLTIALIGSTPLIGNVIKRLDSGKSKTGTATVNLYLLIIMALCIIMLLTSTYNPFIYFRF